MITQNHYKQRVPILIRGDLTKPYHPSGYIIEKPEPTEMESDPEYKLKFEKGAEEVPEELIHGKEVEVQVDDKFQIFGHYKHPYLDFDNSELDMDELKKHVPRKLTIWY